MFGEITNSIFDFLVHYDPNKPIGIVCDSSSIDIEQFYFMSLMTMFTSCTLSAAEKNYSQFNKEALAIMVAVNKFHKFVMVINLLFLLITNH